MTDERIEAVRAVRMEADRLRIACIEAAKTGVLVHLAYDGALAEALPIDHTILLGSLRSVQ